MFLLTYVSGYSFANIRVRIVNSRFGTCVMHDMSEEEPESAGPGGMRGCGEDGVRGGAWTMMPTRTRSVPQVEVVGGRAG